MNAKMGVGVLCSTLTLLTRSATHADSSYVNFVNKARSVLKDI